jgi:hypothetical protein
LISFKDRGMSAFARMLADPRGKGCFIDVPGGDSEHRSD